VTGSRFLIVGLVCATILAISWVVVTSMTTPARAAAAGVILAGIAAVLMGKAGTDRRAVARGIVCVGATAFTAPLAAIQAYQADFVHAALTAGDDLARYEAFEELFVDGWRMVGIGAALGLVLMIAGGVMHRRSPLPD
jgi:hypothetical protein